MKEMFTDAAATINTWIMFFTIISSNSERVPVSFSQKQLAPQSNTFGGGGVTALTSRKVLRVKGSCVRGSEMDMGLGGFESFPCDEFDVGGVGGA
jgi:hypothetical protein